MAGRSMASDDDEEVVPFDQEDEGEDIEQRGDDDEEDEEEEDGQDEYEKDGFIVDDVEDEEPEETEDRESDEERHKKKKRKKRESEKNFVLDEDDYELLEDNNITVHRPRAESKKFKRLKKARRDAEEGRFGLSDEEEYDGVGRGGRTAEKKLERSLFDDDDGGPLEDIPEDEEQMEEMEDGDMADDDEMADFIVDEDMDESGQPVRRKKLAKKRYRQTPGVPSSALQEANEIFGDVEELLKHRKHQLDSSFEERVRRIEDEFEPTILEHKFMTEHDEAIRRIDEPERMQLTERSLGLSERDTKDLVDRMDEESKWIFSQIESGSCTLPLFDKKVVGGEPEVSIKEEHIHKFLRFTHQAKFDVPFIAMYCKDECLSLLTDPQLDDSYERNRDKPALKWHQVLWAMRDLDKKWRLLQKRKSALLMYYNKRFEEESRRVYDETRLGLNKQLFESIIKALTDAESEREVDDVDSKFNLHFPPGEVGVDEGQYKRPKRKSLYSICSKAGLWEVASKFGYSSEQFGLQISLQEIRVDELEDRKETPEDMASSFTCAMFETPQAVLKGARHMAAVEISCEPVVRKHFRSIYFDHAVVSTCPTTDGNAIIDSFHEFASVKWLKNKPLNKFVDAQWLLIQKAEEEKLLQVTIKLPEENVNKLESDSLEKYLSMGVSKFAQLWNDQRKQILQDSIFTFILPSLEKEARSLLTSRSKSWLLLEHGRHLFNKVSVAPYQRKDNDVGSDDEAAPRVMACCWGPGKPPTTFVMLDSFGEVLDILEAGSISLRSQNVNDQQRKKNDQDRLKKFMTEHQPQVVVLGAVNLSCKQLKDDIYEIVYNMVEENPRDVGHEMDGLSVVYGDESLPRLYENSRISSDQLPAQSGIVKRAVALGRYLQNPLAMVATLCGPGREILSWKLNPLEKFLTADEKYEVIEQIMVDVTNQVGLDLNLAISHEWLFAPLQFISGLGPRKAASLQKSLVRDSAISSRKDLYKDHGLGKNIFVNAAGFMRVRRSGLAAGGSQFFDLLDDTRIHPQNYSTAQEMAKDIYREDCGDDNLDDDDALEMAVEHLRERPNVLKSFNVDAYAQDKNRFAEREILHTIKLELIQGYQDWRRQFEEPSNDEAFLMISGETEDTLAEGRIVQATVRRVQPPRAICLLESGLVGMLAREDYSDNWKDSDLTENLHEGDIITCMIKSIDKNLYKVLLSCKENDMRRNRHQIPSNFDPYYHEDRSSIQGEQEKARKNRELAKRHLKQRMIVHPRFHNVTADEAMEFLSDKSHGESVIRPSSRGPSFLTLTIKVYDGVYAHKDIVEEGKDKKDVAGLLRIGKILKIGEDTFEDLDEVIDRYVDPLVAHLKSMLEYRKFKEGKKVEVDELLRAEKEAQPNRIAYSFGISHEHPGTFILTYIRSSNPHHEYIGLYPKGFKFRKKMFEKIDKLVAYFQRHIDEPIHESQSLRAVAASVPFQESGASEGNGWGGSANDDGRRGHSRTGGNDYRNGGGRGGRGGRGGHPSGAPRPYGGRGRGRGSYNGDRDREGSNSFNRQESGYGKWGSDNNDGYDSKWGSSDNKDGENTWQSFPGAKVQNSPGREAFPGGWSSGGGGNNDGGWGSGGGTSSGGGGGGGWGDKSDNAGWGEDAGGKPSGGDAGFGSGSKSSSKGWGGGGGGGGGSW
ncbi:Transcription elongation factor spt6 [Dionaea muscipula]